MKLLLRSLIFSSIILFLYVPPLAHGQTPGVVAQDEGVINQFIQEVLTITAERGGQQAAKVELLTREEKKAKDDLDKTIDAKKEADENLEAARLGVAATRPRTHGGAQSIDMGDYDAYQKNVRFMTISESRVSRLG